MMGERTTSDRASRSPGEEAPGRRGPAPEQDRHENDENIVKRVYHEMMEDDALNMAAGMAYFAFLSLPPMILVIFALTGFFGGDETAEWLTDQLGTVLPDEAGEWIETFVANVVGTQAPGLFSLGLLLMLWAASNVFMAVMRALNIAYNVEERRSFIKQRALALGVLVLFAVFMLLGSALMIAGPQIAGALDLFGTAEVAWSVAQWILPFLLVVGAFALAYYILPAREQKRHKRQILIGAVVGAVVWVLASLAFRLYVYNFANYNQTYGVLGGVIILMLWLYLTMLVILLGGQVSAELERRARHG